MLEIQEMTVFSFLHNKNVWTLSQNLFLQFVLHRQIVKRLEFKFKITELKSKVLCSVMIIHC